MIGTRHALIVLAACTRGPVASTPHAPAASADDASDSGAAVPSTAATTAAGAAAGPASSRVEPARPPPQPQQIDVRYLASEDAWTVAWTFGAPTSGLVFDRRQPGVRHQRWQAGPGQRWSLEGADEVLRPVDGVDRTTFSVRFATDDDTYLRAPPLNLRWRDGGRLLFTGSLGAHALGCRAADPIDRCPRRDAGAPRRWRFTADDGRGLRILGDTGAGALDWAEPPGDLRGTYLYAGDRVATATPIVTIVVDAGVPTWLAAETAHHLPAMLADHAARTGLALPFQPLVLVSRGAGGPHLRALRGRTLPGLVQLEARGGRWDRRSRGAERAWFEFLAHESFHFWNGQLARRADSRDEWWSEGASSFVAGRALREARLLDARGYQRRMRRAAAACLATLRGPLRDDAAESSYYTCGELVHFLADAHQRGRGGLDPLYAALFADAQTRGSYSSADFLDLLALRGAAPAFVADLRQIVDRGLGDTPAAFLARLLTEAGLPTQATPARGRRPPRLAPAPARSRPAPARPPRSRPAPARPPRSRPAGAVPSPAARGTVRP